MLERDTVRRRRADLEEALDRLRRLRFDGPALDYLRASGQVRANFLDRLAELRFTGDVWAVPEGRVVFADEPLLEVEAPIVEAQLAETLLVNALHFPTLVASKATRCVVATPGASLIDFGLRRTPSFDAGLAVARGLPGRLRRHQQRRGVGALRHSARRHGRALLHRDVSLGDRGVPRLRRDLPWPGDPPGRHLRHRRQGAQRGRRRARTGGAGRRSAPGGGPARQRRPRGAEPGGARHPRRRRPAGRAHRRQRRARRGGTGRLDRRRCADRRLRRRHATWHLGRCPNARHGLQAGRIRRAALPQAEQRQTDVRGPKQVWRRRDGSGCFAEDLIAARDEPSPGPAWDPLLQPVMRGGVADALPTLAEIRAAHRKDLGALPARLRALDARPDYPVAHSPTLLARQEAAVAAVRRREGL